MLIKKIKILKNKVKVYLDDGDILEIDKSVYTNFYLYEGKDISKKEIEKIKTQNNSISYLSYALKLRQKALYTEHKMGEKLYAKGANKEQVDSVINYMKKHDLIDDEAFIEDYIEYCNSLNYGKNKIKTKLIEKGIPSDRVNKINFPVSIERKKASNLLPRLEKKYSKYNDKQKKQHIYQAFISQGFDSDVALETIEKIKVSISKEENEKLKKDFDKVYTKLKKKYNKKELRNKIISSLLSKGYRMKDILELIERKGI